MLIQEQFSKLILDRKVNLDRAGNIIEEAKETVLDFLQWTIEDL